MRTRFFLVVFLAATSVALLVDPALGQATEGTPERKWSNSSQLSWVLSKGNSNSNNFSVRNVYSWSSISSCLLQPPGRTLS